MKSKGKPKPTDQRLAERRAIRNEYFALLKAGKDGKASRLAHKLGGAGWSTIFSCDCACHYVSGPGTACFECMKNQAEHKFEPSKQKRHYHAA